MLARKYRPQDFSSLLGQEVTAKILRNALDNQKLAQSFLLCGVRGTGKTTTARIIAKALNCSKQDKVDSKPCGKCDNCLAINKDRHEDVLEVDAASNRSIDDIRELIDQIAYKPIRGRYKVYIMDEVHMLTTPAFNAFLKTLEEPPEYVKFIFATTAAEKIPKTVLSRCQRFDFRRVSQDQLESHLAEVATKEKAEIEPTAIKIIANTAGGSVRDALSLLDTAISGSEGKITGEAVAKMVGLAAPDDIPKLFDLLMRGEAKQALELFEESYHKGAEPENILKELLGLCGRLIRHKASGIDMPEELKPYLSGEAELAVLHRVWQLLLKGAEELEFTPLTEETAKIALLRVIYGHGLGQQTGSDAKSAASQTNPPKANPQGANPQEATSPKANPQEVTSPKANPQEPNPQEANKQEATSQEATSTQANPPEANPQEANPQEVAEALKQMFAVKNTQ